MSDVFLLCVALVSAGFLLIGHCLALYAAYRVLPQIEQQLYNCKIVTDAKRFWGPYSHPGKMYRYSMISLVLTSPGLLHKHGLIDLEQVRNLSVNHRRWITIPSRIGGIGLVTMLAALALAGRLW